ncbi:MAG TPA: TetR/AcrR family transcriptional regulator [Melioribacteraceae bacterium]|nr:TetR/AcrR family transcriptional regulator [Melioribacteraceae bacterium]
MTSDNKKDLILKTARELLSKNGFAKTTLDDIAGALGLKKSSLYYYYENKEELIKDVMIKEEEKFFREVYKDLDKKLPAINKIINFEIAKFEYVAETSKMYIMTPNLYIEFKTKLFEYIKQIRLKELEILDKIIIDGVKNNELINCDTKKVANLILTISEALRHREFYYATFSITKEINFDKAVEEMKFAVKLIFEGLKNNNTEV